jgi:enamine deaminase RidA (YjgF/YER057c/UK114 family)
MNKSFQSMYKWTSYYTPNASRCIAQHMIRRTIHIEQRLEELGIVLPSAPSPKANYNIVCYANGNMLYVSGHLPIKLDGTLITGRIGPNTGGESIPHGYEAARYAGLNILATLKSQLGDLDRVQQIVKVSVSFTFLVRNTPSA